MKRIFSTAIVLLLVASGAFAQSKPIRLIVPWPAGGTVDGVARVLGPKF